MKTPFEKQILQDMRLYNAHSDLRCHMLIFSRCFSQHCERCKYVHQQNGFTEEQDQELGVPSRSKNGAPWFPMEKSLEEGHYKTLMEAQKELKENPMKKFKLDEELTDGPVSRCEEDGCLVSFKSEAARTRHFGHLHNKVDQKKEKLQQCHQCKEKFPSLHYLTRHKQSTGHKKEGENRGRKKKAK